MRQKTLTIQTIYGEKTCAYKDAMLEKMSRM